MKTIHIITGLLLFLVIFGFSLFLISIALQGDPLWSHYLELVRSRKLEAVFIGMGLLFTLVIYGLSAFKPAEKIQYLAYDIEGGGSVSISLLAVQDFVAKLADEFAAVVSLNPALKAVNGGLDVQLDVKVKAGSQIPELCRMLQDRTRECIKEKVGISDIREVRVRVQEIVGEPKAAETTYSESKNDSFA